MRNRGESEPKPHLRTAFPACTCTAQLLASVLAACDPDGLERSPILFVPDASIDASETTCPDGISTWRDVLAYWDDIRCGAFARCFPEVFATWYGDQAGCLAQLGSLHCASGVTDNWCDAPYPLERCIVLLACRAELEALVCAPDAVVPETCEHALR